MKKKIVKIRRFIYIVCILIVLVMLLPQRNTINQYDVYKSENRIVVENKKDPDKFFYEEYIYFSTAIKDAYLCTKDGTAAKSEEEAYLYVDLGEKVDWWGDPFGNLEKDAVIENEYIPDGLINIIEENDIEMWQNISPMIEKAQVAKLTEDEVKAVLPGVYEEISSQKPEAQDYYKADFDNDGRQDIMLKVMWGMGRGAFTESYFYQQMEDGQYKKTFQLNTSWVSFELLVYEGKNYYISVCWSDFHPETEYDYDYCELYYFENGRPQETVRFTPKSANIEESHSSGGESVFDIKIKRRFVNDFINISEGPR